MMPLPHSLTRTIVICATPETVFRFFTDSTRWAKWWGTGSTIDPRPGGQLKIRHPNGIEVLGEVLEVAAPNRIVFTMGYVGSEEIKPGESRVSIRVEPHDRGTKLQLLHEFADVPARDHHVQGWRYQLSLFSNVVTNEAYSEAFTTVDRWLAAWAEADAGALERTLREIATPDVQFRDQFSLVDGLTDLLPHIAAAQRFMPGLSLRRAGNVRHCQGTVLADWTAVGPDGQERAKGTNVFTLGPDGRIEAVTGFWG
jgi:uncharacterized protein YndB with AHSA1/START domain